ncbi:MAG: hypothetical protein LBQ73_03125 [Tannerellaceae bacterium]|jgi:hypothetical protein|nr:hypothetical protein [Tannerellaceae bacterium]
MQTQHLMAAFIGLVLLVSGCGSKLDNDFGGSPDYLTGEVLYPEKARLKCIYVTHYGGGRHLDISQIDPEDVYIASEYEYDASGRIGKVSSPMYDNGSVSGLYSYDLYIYDSNNRLEKKESYHSNTGGFINLQNTTYFYGNSGEKIKEQTDYPQTGNLCKSEYTLFEYANKRLVKCERYECRQLTDYVVFEYNADGENIAEKRYDSDGVLYSTTKHAYIDGLNVKSEVYQGNADSGKWREINRIYDKNKNLIYLQSEELSPLSSATSFLSIYEYEKQ